MEQGDKPAGNAAGKESVGKTCGFGGCSNLRYAVGGLAECIRRPRLHAVLTDKPFGRAAALGAGAESTPARRALD